MKNLKRINQLWEIPEGKICFNSVLNVWNGEAEQKDKDNGIETMGPEKGNNVWSANTFPITTGLARVFSSQTEYGLQDVSSFPSLRHDFDKHQFLSYRIL